MSLNNQHLSMLAASGIDPNYAAKRGYESITDSQPLKQLRFVKDVVAHHSSGLLIPLRRADGSVWGHQFRPDNPRLDINGKPIKYETPWQQPNDIDFPIGVGPKLGDPAEPLLITEGSKKADCAVIRGLTTVGLIGVWNWIGRNNAGGKMVVAGWNDIALNNKRRVIIGFDGDVARKPEVRKAMHALAQYLAHKGSQVEYLWLPDTDNKTGLDDYLMDGHTVADLWQLVKPIPPPENHKPKQGQAAPKPQPKPAPAQPITLDEAHVVFRRWFGKDYDTDALDAELAVVAVEHFDDGSDPVWLLIVSGSAAAKTETVQSLDGVDAVVTSAITGEAALLSATPEKDRAKDATGGLLRKIGDRGVLVVKDVTSILSMNTDTRAKVLAALREIYDGRWYREVGAEGGRSLEWRGRLVVVGAVTTAWDTHREVIASMGDRFILVRIDSTTHRIEAGRRAVGNTGDEAKMRAELSAAVAGVIAGMNSTPVTITNEETEKLLKAADLVTRARTSVVTDYRGDVIDAHAPEMPTRFAKQLTQIVRGGVAIGMDRADALRLAIRCARDSMPPLRLAIIDYLKVWTGNSTQEVRKGIDKPRLTVDRQLQALHSLGVLTCSERPYGTEGKIQWLYTLAPDIDPDAIVIPQSCPGKPPTTPDPYVKGSKGEGEKRVEGESPGVCTDFPEQHSQPGDPSTDGQNPSTQCSVCKREIFTEASLRRGLCDGCHRVANKPPTGPGRCPDCGWNVGTHGHHTDCQYSTEGITP